MQDKTKKKLKVVSAGIALALPLGLFGGYNLNLVSADTNASKFISDHSETITVANGSFNDISGQDMTGDSLSGWVSNDKSSNANGMIINVGSAFSRRQDSYALVNNPGHYGSDNNILMINSRKTSTAPATATKKKYSSPAINLDANSYYRLSVAAKASLDGSKSGEYSAHGSLYIDNLKDNDGNTIDLGYENFVNTSYKVYYFFIATGNDAQEITLDVSLGSNYTDSYGVVFFDEVKLEKYAENTFFTNAQSFGYDFTDKLGLDPMSSQDTKVKFIVDALQDDKNDKSKIDMAGYNFDFEDVIKPETDTLGDAWEINENSAAGHARIMSVAKNSQPSAFQKTTKYDFVGNDLSFNKSTKKPNSQALVLYTNDADSYVSVKSKDIPIKAHGLYKFTIKAKTSEIKSGNFNVLFKENDSIFSEYDITKDDYSPLSGTLSVSSSNSSDKFQNGYTTLTYYVKGHTYYDSNINIIFELGNRTSPCEGCVVIDNIKVQYVDFEEFSSASDKLELKSYSTEDTQLNGLFNNVENEKAELSYPLKASNWTKKLDNDMKNYLISGVLYLRDKQTYEDMYTGETFATSYPGNPSGINSPNNIYLMENKAKSYQSITSSSYTLSADSYYKISFDYLVKSIVVTNRASMSVEIKDENGIVIYHKKGFNSSTFDKAEIFVHTGLTNSSNITVTIHLGEEDDTMHGYLYIDNFKIEGSTQDKFPASGVDLSGYYLNIDPEDKVNYFVSDTSAYNFGIEGNYTENAAKGGIVSGEQNEFHVDKNDSNLLALTTYSVGKPSLTSNFDFTLSDNKFYKLNFELRTLFNTDDDKLKANKEHSCEYGVSVGLSDYTLASKLKSNNDFTTYTIYFKVVTGSSSKFKFILNSDCEDTLGTALLKNINFTEATENEFTSASSLDEFKNTVFTSQLEELDNSDTGSETPEQPDSPDQTQPTNNEDSAWLLIPSLIFGLAIIIAIVGFILRHIKIKKIETIRKESYDKFDLNRDLILAKAKDERDEEAKDIREQIHAIESKREALEAEHKEAVRLARENSKGKISKNTEREFKSYASTIARLNEKEEILKELLDTTLSAEHLISIEKRLALEEEKKLRELESIQKGKSKQPTDKTE